MKISIGSEWTDIVAYILSLGLTLASLLMTMTILWRHHSIRGQDPEWKSHVLPLPLLFLFYSLVSTLGLFLGREVTLYLEGVVEIYQALMTRELFLLLLYLFNKQADFHFPREEIYTLLHKNKCSYNEDAARGKIEHYFIKCPSILSGRLPPSIHLLTLIESLILFSLMARFMSTLLSFLFLHQVHFREYFYLVEVFHFILSLLAFASLWLLILFLEGVIWMFLPRLKFLVLFIPSLMIPLQSTLFSPGLSSFLTGLESLFLLLSLYWIYPFGEHDLTSLISSKTTMTQTTKEEVSR